MEEEKIRDSLFRKEGKAVHLLHNVKVKASPALGYKFLCLQSAVAQCTQGRVCMCRR